MTITLIITLEKFCEFFDERETYDKHKFLPFSRQTPFKDTEACMSYSAGHVSALILAHVGNITTVARAFKVLQKFKFGV